MALLDAIRSAVSIANRITQNGKLQGPVQYQQYLGPLDNYGTKNLASPVTLLCIVDLKQQQVRTKSGMLANSRAHLTILDVTTLATITQGKGIGDQDVLTLQDGSSGPILSLAGFMDAGTGQPIETEVYIG